MCLADGRIPIMTSTGETYLTAQELTCLRNLLQGDTCKQIANRLDISARTVETYLQRIKQRTGCVTRDDLKRLIALCP